MFPFGLTGVTLAEKWTTDNVLTTQITVEDQVFKFILIPFQRNETLPALWAAAGDCENGWWASGSEAIICNHKSEQWNYELVITNNNYEGWMNRIINYYSIHSSISLSLSTPSLSEFLFLTVTSLLPLFYRTSKLSMTACFKNCVAFVCSHVINLICR